TGDSAAYAARYGVVPDHHRLVATDLGEHPRDRGGVPMQFTVGLKLKGKSDRMVVDAEDALIAALKVKGERPEALIMYVRPQNRRGDSRHPSHPLAAAH
ncbi:MAG TPA: hypothetical protein VK281_15290, partial [Xanthobacteraceae bacterium]|nr:hypothetical protein [Xanthobacteraceae bacterium]